MLFKFHLQICSIWYVGPHILLYLKKWSNASTDKWKSSEYSLNNNDNFYQNIIFRLKLASTTSSCTSPSPSRLTFQRVSVLQRNPKMWTFRWSLASTRMSSRIRSYSSLRLFRQDGSSSRFSSNILTLTVKSSLPGPVLT